MITVKRTGRVSNRATAISITHNLFLLWTCFVLTKLQQQNCSMDWTEMLRSFIVEINHSFTVTIINLLTFLNLYLLQTTVKCRQSLSSAATTVWDPWDAFPPTSENLGTKCIWSPTTFVTDIFFIAFTVIGLCPATQGNFWIYGGEERMQ